jgi:hypothetical protein
VFVVLSHEVLDFTHQLFYAAEGAAANGLLGDQGEEVGMKWAQCEELGKTLAGGLALGIF